MKTIQTCNDHDVKLWKCPRFVKDPEQLVKCWQVIEANVVKLKDIFITLVSRSSFPSISWIDFTNFCDMVKIPDRNVGLATVDRLFIATNVELEASDENSDKALCRYEFYEILVRLGNAKYREPGICSNYSDSL